VGAPRNHFEPALVSIVEHERSVMTLVSPSYDSRFAGFNQEADRSARSLVDDHGGWDSSIIAPSLRLPIRKWGSPGAPLPNLAAGIETGAYPQTRQ
jgi:hypothetical protein